MESKEAGRVYHSQKASRLISRSTSLDCPHNVKSTRANLLETTLEVMRDESLGIRLRIDAAKAAAPYVHQRLSAFAVDLTTSEVTHEEWLQSLA